MERKYSKLDLIGEELIKRQDKTLVDKALSFILYSGKYVYIKINILVDLHLRAEFFCDDIAELSEDPFDQNQLLGILYEDFLRENREKEALFNLYRRLNVRDSRSPSINGINAGGHSKRQKTQEITIRLMRKEALRGEVLLSDLDSFYPDHPFTLEMVLETLYMDFLEDVKKGGSQKAVKELLKRMEVVDEEA